MLTTKGDKNQEIKLPKLIQKKIEQIRFDNTSGSAELTKQAAETFIFLVKNISVSNPTKLVKLIKKTAQELIYAQPIMASIINLSNNLLIGIYGIKNLNELKQVVHTNCEQFIQNLAYTEKKIGELTTKIIKDDSIIITHSYSSTLLNTLIFAKENGKKFKVICTESRPINEGLQLAKKLGKKGINVKLVVDAAIFSYISGSDLILVGTDAVTNSGLVNKIGTLGLAIVSKQYNKTMYSLCSTDKIVSGNYPINIKRLKNSNEIIDKKLYNVIPENYYFDLTPLDYLSGIITEKGIQSPIEIKDIINKSSLYSELI
jgi:translation initiation factor 2B subunit (eIF-2B alpha/beta/delta family)